MFEMPSMIIFGAFLTVTASVIAFERWFDYKIQKRHNALDKRLLDLWRGLFDD